MLQLADVHLKESCDDGPQVFVLSIHGENKMMYRLQVSSQTHVSVVPQGEKENFVERKFDEKLNSAVLNFVCSLNGPAKTAKFIYP